MVKEDNFLKNVADFCITKSKNLGCNDVSVLISNTVTESINFRNKKLDGLERSDNIIIFLTTYLGKRKASISSTNLKENKVEELVHKCLEATKITPEDDLNSLPDAELYFKGSKNL